MSDETDSRPTSVAATVTFVTSPDVSFGPSEDSADDAMLTSPASYERSSASNVTSLAPGEMHETDWTENPAHGSSLKSPGFTKEPSSAVHLPNAPITIDDRTQASTGDNPLTTRLSSAADNLPTSAEFSVLDLPMSVASDDLPADVSTQEPTTSDIRLTSSLTDNLLTSVAKASDIMPSSDNALNSLFTSMAGTADSLLTDLTTAEANNDGIGTSMSLDDQHPTSDILMTSSFTTDNPRTPVSSSSSAEDVLNPSYISNERSLIDTTESSLLIRSSLGSIDHLPSAARESLSSAAREILSSAAREILSSAAREILSSATSLSSFGPEVKTLSGTISGKLDQPPDYHTASADDGQSRASATDDHSSETMVPRNHVTSPAHVTGNRPAVTSVDRGVLFDEYKNRAPNGNDGHSPTQSTESNAFRVTTNDFSSSSPSSSNVPPFLGSTTSEPSRGSSNSAVLFSVVFGTMSAFVLALLLLNCVAIFLSAKRKDRRHHRRRPGAVARNISTISFRQISTQADATVINVIVDEEEEEEEEAWTDDNVDLLTHSPQEIDPSSPSYFSSSAAAAAAGGERSIPDEDGCDVPVTRCAGLEPGALQEEEEEVGAGRSPGATGGAGEKQHRRPGESRRNGDAKGLRTTGKADDGSTRGRDSSPGTRSLPRTALSLQCTSRPSADPLSNVSTFTRTTTTCHL